MNKVILKHISIILTVFVVIILFWLLFIYIFFDKEIKKTIYPIIDDSKQNLSEIVSKDFASDKVNKFISELEKNKYIRYISVIDNNVIDTKKESKFLSLLKLSYPIKNGKVVAGMVEVWPSYELFAKIFSDKINIIIFLISIIFLFAFIISIIYLYVQKYIFIPFKQIKNIINDIILDKEISTDELYDYYMWNSIFLDFEKLHNKVFCIDTTMKLLLSATSIINSDFELLNSMHVVFDVVQKKIKDVICILLIPDDSGQLKIFAKNDSLKDNSIFVVNKDNMNYISQSYTKNIKIVVNDSNKITRGSICDLCDETINSLMINPLSDENKKCIGVFVVLSKQQDSFNDDNVEIIDKISSFLVALMKRTKNYQEIKETNRSLELEVDTLSKEIMDLNSTLIKKIKDINNLTDINFNLLMEKTLADSISFIIFKLKDILNIENFGVFVCDKKDKSFVSIKGSFGLRESFKIENEKEKELIYNNIINCEDVFVLNEKDYDIEKYRKIFCDIFNLESAMFIPLRKRTDVIAIIVAINKVKSSFDNYDIKILKHISAIIYAIIKRISLDKELKANIKMGEANGNS